ncbi:unnamed protein product [Clonostachys solani]|uniref:Nephrocystin 3-like N-terminal domain-containing protein n=1 Tax=Clonostachys solani TaxID=160281 RepID=A0A9N9W8D9_9HYPO|nr:unnamed protein product [Clonostachys solani]
MSTDETLSDAVVLGQDDISDFNEQGILPVPDETKAKIREWLQATPYSAQNGEYDKHRLSHLEGTGDWLLDSKPFTTWHGSEDQGLLWIRGIPGSGKSVIAADLIKRLSKENAPVLYFFFRQIIEANHAPDSLLRDWLHQILQHSPPLQVKIEEDYLQPKRELSSVAMATLWKDLKLALSSLPKVYCVVDALDEMDEDNDGFLEALAELAQWRPSNVKVIMTSRPLSRLERPLRRMPIIHLRLEETFVDIDIATYVAHRLQSSAGRISESDQEIIRQAVPGKANGLFLYAKLAMDSFLKEGADVKQVLTMLPADLNIMYTDLLQEHAMRSGVPHDLQILILSCVTHATYPLRLLEVAEMVNVTQNISLKEDLRGDLKAIKKLVRDACGPLIEVLPDETLCVIHHSLTEFLTGSTRGREDDEATFPILDPGSTNVRLAEACIHYILRSECLKSPLIVDYRVGSPDPEPPAPKDKGPLLASSEIRSKFPFLQYSLENWHVHIRRAEMNVELPETLMLGLDELITEETLTRLERLHNKHLPQKSLVYKVAALGLTQYLTKLIKERHMKPDEFGDEDNSPLVAAVEAGHASTVKQLLAFGARAEFNIKPNGHTPLHKAALLNHGELVELLLQAGADPLAPKTEEDAGCYPPSSKGQTPLMYATLYGLESATSGFVRHLKDAASVNKGLAWAALSGNPAVVQTMLTHPLADVNAIIEGNTPLFLAGRAADPKTMILLLEAGADASIMSWGGDPNHSLYLDKVNEPYYSFTGYNALHALCGAFDSVPKGYDRSRAEAESHKLRSKTFRPPAEKFDSESIKRLTTLLLERRIDVDGIDEEGKTPLLYAAQCRPSMVKYLLDAGADSGFRDRDGKNAFHGCKDVQVLQLLAKEGKANINQESFTWRLTPFLSAMVRGTTPDLIKMLVSLGADVTSVGLDGKGAWHQLLNDFILDKNEAGYNILDLIDALVGAGVPLNTQDNEGKTPLQAMPRRYHDLLPRIYSRLIKAGARIDIREHSGRTLLFHAVQLGNIELVQILLHAGADSSVRDKQGRNLYFVCKYTDPSTNIVGKELIDAKMVNFLRNIGVDPTIRDNEGVLALPSARDMPDNHGRISLHYEFYDDRDPLQEPLDAYQDVDLKDYDGVRPLHIACKSSEQLVAKLLAAGASPTEPTHMGMTPLHIACRFRQSNIVGILLEEIEAKSGKQGLSSHLNTAWRQVPDDWGAEHKAVPPILFLACSSGVPETVSLLLNAGADPNLWFGDREEGSCLTWCLKYESEEKLWKNFRHQPGGEPRLSLNFFGLSMKDDCGRIYEFPERQENKLADVLDLLQEHGLDLMAMGKQERMPKLDYAIANWKSGDYALECLLRLRQRLTGQAETQAPDSDDPWPNPDGYVEALVKTRGSIDASPTTVDKIRTEADFKPSFRVVSAIYRQAALREAFMRTRPWDEPEVLHDLLDNHQWGLVDYWARNDPNFYDMKFKRTCNISVLVAGGHLQLVRQLLSRERIRDMKLKHRALFDSTGPPESCGIIPNIIKPLLLGACRAVRGNMPMLRYLVEDLSADVNIQDVRIIGNDEDPHYTKGTSPLHIMASRATWWQSAEGLQYLIDHGADVHSRDHRGRTPLLRAVGKLWKMPHDRSNLYRSLKILTQSGADVNATDSAGNSCLSLVADDKVATDILIKAGARVTPVTVFEAITINYNKGYKLPSLEDLEALITAIGANARMPGPEDGGPTPTARNIEPQEQFLLYVAAWRNPDENYSIQVTETDDEVRKRHMPLIQLLLNLGANPFATFRMRPEWDLPAEEVTLLHYLLEEGGFVEQILDLPGLDLERRDQKGRTVLLSACRSKVGPDMDIDALNELFTERLPSCVPQRGRLSIFKTLEDKGACLTARDNEGKNALHHILEANRGGGHAAIQTLITRHPELASQTDTEGRAPIYYALSRCNNVYFNPDFRSVAMLLDAGVDPTFVDHDGNTALHLFGTSMGRVEESGISPRDLFKRLLSFGLSVNAVNNEGETPIFYFLQGQGSKKEVKDVRREMDAQTEALEALADAGAEFSVTNSSGDTLLHVVSSTQKPSEQASEQAHISELMVSRFRWLLEKGVDPMAENDRQQTCLDIASASGNEAILSLFEHGPETSKRRRMA